MNDVKSVSMRFRSFVFCCFFLSALASAGQNLTIEGEVMGLWNYDTVKVTGDVFLPEGATLMIGPGVIVEFQGYYNFRVEGDIQVLGIPEEPVLFTINDTTGLYDLSIPAGGWNGITFLAESVESGPFAWFEHTRFEYAKAWQGDTLHHGGAIFLSGPVEATFLHCTFADNIAYLSGAGIYFYGASPRIEQCFFSGNQAGHYPPQDEQYGYGGGLCGIYTKAVVRGNVFFGNASTGIGGGLSFDSSDPLLENNIFEANDSPLGGGFGILRSQVMGTIANNLVLNNTAMFFGGGLALIATRASLSNNTIAGNYGGYGGGLYFNAEAFVKIHNTILWGNWANGPAGGSAFIWDALSIPNFYNCLIEGGIELIDGAAFLGEFVDNITKEPLFTGAGDWPWQLQPASPAINAGTEDPGFLMLPENDLAGNPRIQLGRLDMGAFESDSIFHTSVQTLESNPIVLQILRNPARGNTSVRLNLEQSGPVRILLVEARGQVQWIVFDGFMEPGQREFRLDLAATGLAKGVYYVVAHFPGGKASARLVVL